MTGGDTVADDDDEVAARARLDETSGAIVARVEAALPPWVIAAVGRILDAWGGADDVTRARAESAAISAGTRAAARVGAELRVLFALEPSEQASTPLEVVRTAAREPTAVLVDAGVPAIERDRFEERAFPDDRYGLVPHTLGDLGDDELGPLQLVWGLAKAAVLRGRTAPPPSHDK